MITTKLAFFVPGIPAPQGSKRHIGHGILIESSKQLAPWREHIGWTATAANNCELMTGPITIDCDFIMPRPKATPKTYTPAATKRPDLDKLLRAVLDALTGVLIIDDAQITDIRTTKRLAEPNQQTGVHITICGLTEEATA